MKRLIIKQLGPVTSVDIELNKINVIIGPQSSGKSTVNKVACFCSWLEKAISIRQHTDFVDAEDIFATNLIAFHKLEGFTCQQTYIAYESEVMNFSFSNEGEEFQFKWKDRWDYKRCKTAYIPAERNIVATIPNWFEVKLRNNSIRSFMSAWEEARNCFLTDKELTIMNLGISYYYDKEKRKDWVVIGKGKMLEFTNTSSGLQSLIPLYVVLQYITHELFLKGQEEESIENLTYFDAISKTLLTKFSNKKECETIKNNYKNIRSTNIYMEEPEENLFPTTQRDLIYTFIQMVNADRNHHLFLTTHSPYILYALNNCMMANTVKDKINPELIKQLPCLKACIDPQQVSLWQMENGQLHAIKKADTQTLGAHDFNDAMNEILNEYYIMMNFIG